MATERRNWLYATLLNPKIYEAVQRIMGADAVRRHFAATYVQARPADRILDIGCGPAQLLEHLPPVQYVGWEPNPAYTARARIAYRDRGEFHTGLFGPAEAAGLPPVDIAVVSGVLHHMDDAQVRELFALLRGVLKPGGHVATVDNVYVDKQNPVARFIISRDRGKHVRSPDQYLALARTSFADVVGTVEPQSFPPYTRFFMVARNSPC